MSKKIKFEIERKWLITSLPEAASKIAPIEYERYFPASDPGEEVRIQKVGDKYIYQKKVENPGIGRERVEDREISLEEFLDLKKGAVGSILRTRYDLSSNIAIQVYHGKYEGLIRYEVEFSSVAESEAYVPDSWLGREITDSPLGRDSRLLSMSDVEFQEELRKYSTI